MTTILLQVLGPDGEPATYTVQEDFDTVIEKIWPTQGGGYSSALAHREAMIFTHEDGGRMIIPSGMIAIVKEEIE